MPRPRCEYLSQSERPSTRPSGKESMMTFSRGWQESEGTAVGESPSASWCTWYTSHTFMYLRGAYDQMVSSGGFVPPFTIANSSGSVGWKHMDVISSPYGQLSSLAHQELDAQEYTTMELSSRATARIFICGCQHMHVIIEEDVELPRRSSDASRPRLISTTFSSVASATGEAKALATTLLLFHLLVLGNVEAALADLVEEHQVVAGSDSEGAASVGARRRSHEDCVFHLVHVAGDVRHHAGEAGALRVNAAADPHSNLRGIELTRVEGGIDAAVHRSAHDIARLVKTSGRSDEMMARHIITRTGRVILHSDHIFLTLLREGRVQLHHVTSRGHSGGNCRQ